MALRKSKSNWHPKSSRARKRRRQQKLGCKLSFEKLEHRQMLATFTVTNLNDAGSGSLRAMINTANNNPGADEIGFASTLFGTINLTSGELEITDTLTINGPGQNELTIDAQQNSRVLNFTEPGDLTVKDLTVTGGLTTEDNSVGLDTTHGGGGIRYAGGIFGLLTLDGVTLRGNRTEGRFAEGGGAFSIGFISVIDSTIEGNSTEEFGARGGGIYSRLAASVIRSEVTGNWTDGFGGRGGGIGSEENILLTESTVSRNRTFEMNTRGGGIFTFDDVIAVSSTVSGNSTAGENSPGGGIYATGVTLTNTTVHGNITTGSESRGGGISASDVTLTNSTVSGNATAGIGSSGGGIIVRRDATITNSTITRNVAATTGHGIEIQNGEGDTVRIENSIVSNNNTGRFQDINLSDEGTFIANYSFLGSLFPGGIGGSGNIFSETPLLGSLADNGGRTLTHAPLPGSRVIDAGDPSIVFNANQNDQRGVPFVRVFDSEGGGARIDMGAVEAQTLPASSFVVDSTSDIDDGDYSRGQFTLREAIHLANLNPAPDTITFNTSVAGGEINLAGVGMEITDALTIDATMLDQGLMINALIRSRIFDITETAGDVTLSGLSLLRGRTAEADEAGGAIRSLTTGDLTLEETDITNSSTRATRSAGGAIFAAGDVFLFDSSISGNSTIGSFSRGGGIASNGNVFLANSDVLLNRTTGTNSEGGGILAFGRVSLELDSDVSGNETTGDNVEGGGIAALGNVLVVDSRVRFNRTTGASSTGGGIYSGSNVEVRDGSEISGNTTEGDDARGGGIDAVGEVDVTDSTVSENGTEGPRASGGGFHANGDVTVIGSTISGNFTEENNSQGGGFYSDGNVTLNSSTVSGNETLSFFSDGAGFASTNDVTITQSTITNNQAMSTVSSLGGGFWNDGDIDTILISNSIIAGNTAISTSADIFPGSGSLSVTSSLIGVANQFPGPVVDSTNLSGTPSNPLDPMLGPLTDNGGATFTHPLLPDSPAINAGSNALALDENGIPLTSDQRGVVRVQSGTVDMGAFESNFDDAFLVGDANLNGKVDFLDISPFISLLSNGTFLDQADVNRDGVVDFLDISPFISILTSGGSTSSVSNKSSGNSRVTKDTSESAVTSAATVVEPPAVSAESLVSVSQPETIVSVVKTDEAPVKMRTPLTKPVAAKPAVIGPFSSPIKPLLQLPLILEGNSLASPAVEKTETAVVKTTIAKATPIDTFFGPAAFSTSKSSLVDDRDSSLSGFRNDAPLVAGHSLKGSAERIEFSNETSGQLPSVNVSQENFFSSAAELFDAHPESLDDVFDFEFAEILAGLI